MSYRDQTIAEFAGNIASENVAPAGGTAAAVSAAIGASLCEMACIQTKSGDAAEELEPVGEALREQREHLLTLADEDREVIDEFVEAYPDDPGPETMKRGVGVPLSMAEACLNVLERAAVVVEEANPSAVPDAVTGAYLARSALEATVYIVHVNLEEIEDESFVEDTEQRAAEIEAAAGEAFEQVEP